MSRTQNVRRRARAEKLSRARRARRVCVRICCAISPRAYATARDMPTTHLLRLLASAWLSSWLSSRPYAKKEGEEAKAEEVMAMAGARESLLGRLSHGLWQTTADI